MNGVAELTRNVSASVRTSPTHEMVMHGLKKGLSFPSLSSSGTAVGKLFTTFTASALIRKPEAQSQTPNNATAEKIQSTVLQKAVFAGLGATLALFPLNIENKTYANFMSIPLYVGAAKVALTFMKEEKEIISEKESKELQSLFTGVLTGISMTALENSTLPLSEAEKTILSITFMGIAVLSSVAFEQGEVWNYFDSDKDENPVATKKLNIQDISTLATNTSGVAFMAHQLSTLMSNPHVTIIATTALTALFTLFKETKV